MPTRLLLEDGHDIAVFYANSNIAPQEEYERRLVELQKYAGAQGFQVIEGNYDPSAWEREVAPIGEAIKDFSPALGSKHAGNSAPPPESVAELLDDERRRERCRACYRLRLEEAAAAAVEGGYEGLATTLAVSPYQFSEVIHEELERACQAAGIAAHFEDYRPYYDEATRISRELGMYRQNYCGCRFSVQEGQATRAFIKQQKKARKAGRALERKRAEDADAASTAQLKAKKKAYAEAQAKKKAILKALREKDRSN